MITNPNFKQTLSEIKEASLTLKFSGRPLSIQEFSELLLVHWSQKRNILDCISGTWETTAFLPIDYQLYIKEILEENESWKAKFSNLIDMNYYYRNQEDFSNNLSYIIQLFLKRENVSFDDKYQEWVIPFHQKEIDSVMKKYPETIHSNMDHFSNLLQSNSRDKKILEEFEQTQKAINEKYYSYTKRIKK